MNELLQQKTLAQIVTEHHQAAFILEKYNLDFCCRGKRSLQDACAQLNIQADVVARELESAIYPGSVKVEFNRLTLTELVDFIVAKHHGYVRTKIPQILSFLQKIESKHGGRHTGLKPLLDVFTELSEEMDLHMQKEEEILFPRIKYLDDVAASGGETRMDLQPPIAAMEAEHDHAGRLLEQIRQLTSDYTPPSDACTTYRLSFAALQAFEQDLHQHIHLENNILFPKAIETFEYNISKNIY